MIKKIIPPGVRLRLRVLQRGIKDIINGQEKHFITKNAEKVNYESQIQISQPIKPNAYADNKIHNLRLGISNIENKEISVNQIFSFWKLIPQATKENGFKEGRNLIGDGLSTDFGGGLCQLSGILYHLCLLAGLSILERHPHSKDIYTEETRFTPLGSDATVVYGYKDLRVRNSLTQSFCFRFEVTKDKITAHLCSKHPITLKELIFEAFDYGKDSMAKVSRKSEDEVIIISEDVYEKL